MEIRYKDIILRDMLPRDIEDEVRWMTSDTEWMILDTPWEEIIPQDPDEIRNETAEMIACAKPDRIRYRLEIEHEGRHVGFVSSYFPAPGSERFLGIEICEPFCRGKGIGTMALEAFMDYYGGFGENIFSMETWSGNTAMLRCAEKLGFSESGREKAVYTVCGKAFDAITLHIER